MQFDQSRKETFLKLYKLQTKHLQYQNKTNPVLAASTSTCPYTASLAVAFAFVSGGSVASLGGPGSTLALPRRKTLAAVPACFGGDSKDLAASGQQKWSVNLENPHIYAVYQPFMMM